MENKKIGFIGQGWIGKNYADDFKKRGYEVICYALEEPYINNKENIKNCDIVFVAVPTPTTPNGFDDSIVREAISNIGSGKIAVIKSTLKPGTTRSIQEQYPDIIVIHSPEFLSRSTVSSDVAHPIQNIMGIPLLNDSYRAAAELVLSVLPTAPSMIVSAETAEFYKYVHNTTLFARSIFMNLLYEIAEKLNIDWDDIKRAIQNDPMIAFQIPTVSHWHIEPRHVGGRGVGGDCHIKDMETFSRLYADIVGEENGKQILNSMKEKNIKLLLDSNKDIDLLKGVYGEEIIKK